MPKVLHSQGTWKLAKCSVCVRNGYDGDSEIIIIIIIIIITSNITIVFENALNSQTLNSKQKYLTTSPK